MKRSNVIHWLLFVCLAVINFQVSSAGLTSLRGDAAIEAAEPAPPELERFINDKENVDRTFKQQPPLIPHTNEKYTINLRVNKCLDCHMKQPGKDEAKSVEMSESHFMDRAGNKLDHPSGARHFCTQCHVPQIDAKPLVENTFKTVAAN
ncbi:MAG: nitrate reductase cytochrome c-type subunit [Gammaproteobacteria bacterium]|nr:nitrate reductase cytochrome c-type subunit [Gammaproteobacteria bacterium]